MNDKNTIKDYLIENLTKISQGLESGDITVNEEGVNDITITRRLFRDETEEDYPSVSLLGVQFNLSLIDNTFFFPQGVVSEEQTSSDAPDVIDDESDSSPVSE